MSEKVQKSGGGVGKIFLGIFLGFLLTIGLICGLGFYLYYNVSINWLGKFGVHIDTGSKTVNEMTLKGLVDTSMDLIVNIDTTTLEDIEQDFDITLFKDNKLLGVDISDLKNVGLTKLTDAIKTKFNTISAYEIEGAVNLNDKLGAVLNSPKTFYVKQVDSKYKLFTDKECTNEATDITATIVTEEDGLKVTVKTFLDSKAKVNPEDNSVQIITKYLPLTYALSDVENNTVAELLNFKEVEAGVYKKDNGAGETVTGIMRVLAPLKVSEISNAIDNLTVGQIFEGKIAGTVLELIPENTPIAQVSTELASAVKDASVQTLVDLKILNIDNYDAIKTKQVGSTGKTLAEIKLNELINACIGSLVA